MTSDSRSGIGPRSCPACAFAATHTLFRQRFVLPDGHPLNGGYTVVGCDRCGMVFASDVPSRQTYDLYYETLSKYSTTSIASSSGIQAWDRERLLSMAQLLAEHCTPSATHIVDIGCGSGGSLLAYDHMSFRRITGVDPSPSCVESASALMAGRKNIDIQMGSLHVLPNVISEADLLVLSHVLEHVPDVQSALKRILSSSNGQIILYIEVPDAQAFAEHVESPFLEFNAEHINYFTESTLRRAVEHSGWVVRESGRRLIKNGTNTLYPVAWLVAVPDACPLATSSAHVLDADGEAALLAYVAACSEKLERTNSGLRLLVEGSRELIVWGVGQTTGILLANTVLGKASIRRFTDGDSRYWGKMLAGVRIEPPTELSAYPNVPIFVASTLSAAAIRQSIRELALQNEIIELGALIT